MPIKPNGTFKIADRTVIISLKFRKLGTSKKVQASEALAKESKAKRDRFKVSKTLFESQSYTDIKTLDGKIGEYVRGRSLPSLFKEGVYLLPIPLIDEVDARLAAFAKDRQVLVNIFVAQYPSLVKEAAEDLAEFFSLFDYPNADQVARHFAMSWQYAALEVPESLKSVSERIFKQEQEKAAKRWKDAEDAARKLLRAEMAELVNAMVVKLEPAEEGKRKVFRPEMNDAIKDFLAVFDARNITDDDELKGLAGKAKKLLRGIMPTDLRDDDTLRENVKAGFESLAVAMEGMVELAPERAISFDE